MKRTKVIDALQCTNYGSDITVKGWVRSKRGSKGIFFIALNDGSTIKNVQIVADEANFDEEMVKQITTGACLSVEGVLVESPAAGQASEIQAKKIEVLGTCGNDYPMQKKGQTFEYMRQHAHMRLRTNTFGAVMRIRHNMAMAIHTYFHEHGYFYFHTPLITASDCEGAGQMFQVTTKNLYDLKKDEQGSIIYDDDFFGKQASLTVSGQLEGELGATALGAIYTFGPTFRAEKSDTNRHVCEFWHVEPEVCFVDIDEIIEIGEDFIKHVIKDVMENCADELAFCDRFLEKGLIEKLSNVVNNDFARIDYTDAVEILQKSGKKFDNAVNWGDDLQTEHERYLTDVYFKKPVFVVNYPKDLKAFYMKQNPDGRTVAATDLLVPGIGEIIGCSERETDYEKLTQAMLDRNMPLESYTRYLDTRRFGTVQHSGFGLGFDRLVMYVTGITNIRDVLQFPRTYGHIY